MLSDGAPGAPQAERQKLQLVLIISEARPAVSPVLGSLVAIAFSGIIPLEANFMIGGTGRELVAEGRSGNHSLAH